MEQLIAPLSKTLGKKPAAKDPAAAAAGGANVTTGKNDSIFVILHSYALVLGVLLRYSMNLTVFSSPLSSSICLYHSYYYNLSNLYVSIFLSLGPEADRALDLVKSAVRAVLAVNTIDDIANINRKWAEFADKVKKDEYTAELVRALENEKAFEGNY